MLVTFRKDVYVSGSDLDEATLKIMKRVKFIAYKNYVAALLLAWVVLDTFPYGGMNIINFRSYPNIITNWVQTIFL